MLRGREERIEAVSEKQIMYTRTGSLKTPAKRASPELAHPFRYYLKRFSGSMADALRIISPVKSRTLDSSTSSSSSSSSFSSKHSSRSSRQQLMMAGSNCPCTFAATRRHSIGTDHHRAEAIDDCIKFIKSTLSRSKSLSP
ncbi:unnamed protein product [Cuscuta epithymum]|uniref:Josephin-like protein n=1 Tax=Cuscuta epithymum TaxID=186058 RepID=A0AAV0FTI2_9ASTE|nr:unnamed protein product [Cuscuta epithymum]